MGDYVKLWVFWEGTKKTLDTFYSYARSSCKFLRLYRKLESSLTFLQSSENAVDFRDFIHATVTLRPGFLLGKSYTTSECLGAGDLLLREYSVSGLTNERVT